MVTPPVSKTGREGSIPSTRAQHHLCRVNVHVNCQLNSVSTQSKTAGHLSSGDVPGSWAASSSGRAPVLQTGGAGFKSPVVHAVS
jgi:hypothetical protein